MLTLLKYETSIPVYGIFFNELLLFVDVNIGTPPFTDLDNFDGGY